MRKNERIKSQDPTNNASMIYAIVHHSLLMYLLETKIRQQGLVWQGQLIKTMSWELLLEKVKKITKIWKPYSMKIEIVTAGD